jgi:DNA polymerase type B, organellar and viral
MITSELFHKLKYRGIRNGGSKGTEISEFIAMDSEALTSGRPFLFCFSDGRSASPSDVVSLLFKRYNQRHIVLWNLKYDSGALLYDMPDGKELPEKDGLRQFEAGKIELWVKNVSSWIVNKEKISVEYIPHKFLKLSKGKERWIKFWDIMQFYSMSLDNASKKYLDEAKIKMETKSFTADYVKRHIRKLTKYCVRDAKLTARLGNYFLRKLDEFGIRCTAIYSEASLSFRYFQDNARIIHVKRYWRHYKDSLKFAMDSYEGGKFEITARGAFSGFEYDITSAYPYEIANLVDISFAEIKETNKYQKNAVYGFLHCLVEVYEDVHVPCGILEKNTRIYPIGKFYVGLTKNEYDYLLTIGAKVRILSGVWLFVNNVNYPYRGAVMELYKLKHRYKGKDAMLYSLTKIMMNGFYGKMAECREDWRGTFQAGIGWNPFYASVITANTRLRVTELQNVMKSDCIAVHTDSVITLTQIPDRYLGNKIGDFEQVESGDGIMIACGCYQVGKGAAFKGFEAEEGDNWRRILERFKDRREIPYEALRVESWTEAVSKGHFDKINLFQKMPKDISLNADIKRIWKKDNMRAADFLSGLHRSEPRIIVQNSKPSYW